jgi:hypothetical protein
MFQEMCVWTPFVFPNTDISHPQTSDCDDALIHVDHHWDLHQGHSEHIVPPDVVDSDEAVVSQA